MYHPFTLNNENSLNIMNIKILLFFSIVISLFSLLGYLLFTRIGQAFPFEFVSSKIFLSIYVFLLSSFFVGKILENISINILSESLIRIGSVAAGFFVYALLAVLFFDILRGVNSIIPFFPTLITENYSQVKLLVGILSFIGVSTIMIIGFANTIHPKIKNLDLNIQKPKSALKELNIVAVSDIHLGTMVNHSKAKRLVKTIQNLNPDLILIGGDIIDDNVYVVKKADILKHFKALKPKYGIYSCMGNHEYISRAYKELDYIENNGIIMLKDSSVTIQNLFCIIGRDDKEAATFGGEKRKSLNELTKDLDLELPVFLLDHQPFKLSETAEYPIDLQFSGHTHNGQFWPFNYITSMVFEKDWGYLKKGSTHFYVSSGYGTSVPPIRVGNNAEVVHIKINNSSS